MANVVIYTKNECPFSKEAKAFFKDLGKDFTEFPIDHDRELKAEMEEKSNGRTDTPQIFINAQHIGSFDDVKALKETGKLEQLLD